MMKKIVFACAVALSLAGVNGCTTIAELPPEEVKKQGDSPEFRLCRELLMEFLKGDASGFVSHLSPEVQKVFTADKFRETRDNIVKNLGEPVSFRYLTTLELVALKPNIWAVRFKRVNPQTGREFYQEVLFRVITAEADGRVNVVSFNFL